MMDSAMKRLAIENGLTAEKGVAYGHAQGCFISLCSASGCYQLSIYIGHPALAENIPEVKASPAEEAAAFISAQAANDKRYGLLKQPKSLPDNRMLRPVALCQSDDTVLVRFQAGSGASKHIQAFIEDILPRVAPMTTPRTCCLCGKPVTDPTAWLMPDDSVVPVHSRCVEERDSQAAPEPVKPNHTLLAILCAIIGALLGAAVWALVGIAGYVASVVGMLIAFLAIKGYDLAHGRPGALKTVTILICVILAVVVGTAGAIVYQLHEVYVEGVAELRSWEKALPEMEYFSLIIPELMQDSEFIGSLMKDLLLGWFFAFLGSFGLLRSAGKRDAQRQAPVMLNGGFGQ